jgi:hypothetical protein
MTRTERIAFVAAQKAAVLSKAAAVCDALTALETCVSVGASESEYATKCSALVSAAGPSYDLASWVHTVAAGVGGTGTGDLPAPPGSGD